ncbi:Thiamine-phosphate synthase [uncultured Desulfobacterium sp.]|uniref:Thiamine-phosphate synthase n=1 Tax=uncultured Desulfobacterium sp. TaxID=201089 RepID=A0A445MV99_9BACT|nr:Thiamine-phosphate synthase [uncultured Desulfobacterium sp.]
MKPFYDIRLYCFSPGEFLKGRDPLEIVMAQIRGGADVIQLREKQMGKKARLELGGKIRAVTRREAIPFIVNDDVDIALILDADGVHLGQDDIPIKAARPLMRDKIIGVSTHSVEQAMEAIAAGADYIGVGPVFETATKKDRAPLVGLELLRRIKDICPIPYVAIGGIGKDNIASVIEAGCHRAAVISDILLAPDIEDRCRLLKGMLE